jgi:hypothetical protein
MANKKIKDKLIKIEFKGNELYHLKHFIQEFRDVLIKTENFKKPFNKACFKIYDSYNKLESEVK